LFLQLLALAGAEVRRLLEAGALLREGGDDLEAERLRELAQLGERRVELGVGDDRPLNRGYYGLRHGGGDYQLMTGPLLTQKVHSILLAGAPAVECSLDLDRTMTIVDVGA